MYKFIYQILERREHIYWRDIISTRICEQLVHVKSSLSFHMNSYLAYIAATMGTFVGLSTKGDKVLVSIWSYYEQLTFIQSKHHYRRVQDAFYEHFKCRFDKELTTKRMLDSMGKVS